MFDDFFFSFFFFVFAAACPLPGAPAGSSPIGPNPASLCPPTAISWTAEAPAASASASAAGTPTGRPRKSPTRANTVRRQRTYPSSSSSCCCAGRQKKRGSWQRRAAAEVGASDLTASPPPPAAEAAAPAAAAAAAEAEERALPALAPVAAGAVPSSHRRPHVPLPLHRGQGSSEKARGRNARNCMVPNPSKCGVGNAACPHEPLPPSLAPGVAARPPSAARLRASFARLAALQRANAAALSVALAAFQLPWPCKRARQSRRAPRTTACACFSDAVLPLPALAPPLLYSSTAARSAAADGSGGTAEGADDGASKASSNGRVMEGATSAPSHCEKKSANALRKREGKPSPISPRSGRRSVIIQLFRSKNN